MIVKQFDKLMLASYPYSLLWVYMLGTVQLEQIFSPQRSFILSCDARIFLKKKWTEWSQTSQKAPAFRNWPVCSIFRDSKKQKKEKSPMRCERIAAAFKEKTSD